MTWFRTDDGFWRHRKVRKLGRQRVTVMAQVGAAGLWLLAGTWASDENNTTDGFIPREQVEDWDPKLQLAERLVAAGLWHPAEHDGEVGYRYHDWPDYQPTADEIAERRAKRAAAGRLGGIRSGESRRSKAEANASASATPPAEASVKQKRTPSRPVPSASNEAEESPTGATAQTIIAEYIERCSKTPPRNVINQLGKHIKAMLEEGIDPNDVRRGLAAWMAKDLAPSLLPSLVNQAMNGRHVNGAVMSPTDASIKAFAARHMSNPNLLALPGGAS